MTKPDPVKCWLTVDREEVGGSPGRDEEATVKIYCASCGRVSSTFDRDQWERTENRRRSQRRTHRWPPKNETGGGGNNKNR